MSMARSRRGTIATLGVSAALILGIFALAEGAAARSNAGSPVRQGAATGHTVTVQGHGEATVAPDMATITLGVENHDSNASAALAANASRMTDVINAVKGKGVPDSHIQTSNLSIYYDSQHDYYVVSHQVTVRIDDIASVGPVLDAAVSAGANSSWGVSFGLKDPSAARADALKSAIADARTRANGIASALGVSITGVGSAQEATSNYTPVPLPAGAYGAPAASTPVQAGQLTVSADVTVVYTFG